MKNYILLVLMTTYVLCFFIYDIWKDWQEDWSWHFIFESVAVFSLLILIFYFFKEWHQNYLMIQNYKKEIDQIQSSIWAEIEKQFQEWKLTSAEQEIAMMLIKGFSMKEISKFRSTAENTVRQQANTIYKKADLQGRHELSGCFIEEIFSEK